MILDWYLLLVAFILGIVEGLTEFLPISSTLHLIVIGELLGLRDNNEALLLLNVIIQLGSSLSIIIIFWNEFFVLLMRRIYFGGFKCFNKPYLSCGHIILGILPTVLLGLIFYKKITSIFKIEYMIYSLIFGSVLLLIAEWCICKFFVSNCVSDIDDLSYFQAFMIGCFQCLSLYPGFSRSGATISGGLLVGVNRYVSSIFSFLLAVPIMFSAAILVLYKNFYIFTWDSLPMLITGFLSSFLVSLYTVRVFIRIIQYVSFVPFVIYRFVLAIVIYVFF